MTVITPQRSLLGTNSSDLRNEVDRMLTRLSLRQAQATAPGTANADAETVAGTGTHWTLEHTPAPPKSLILVQSIAGFGGVILFSPADYTLSDKAITTVNTITAGALKAWYRF